MNIIKRLKNWFMGPCTKRLQIPFALPRIQPENYLCQFHSIPLLCSCVLWHTVFLWLLYLRRTYYFHLQEIPTLLTSIIAVTRLLVFGPFNRCHNSAAGLAVPAPAVAHVLQVANPRIMFSVCAPLHPRRRQYLPWPECRNVRKSIV